jgi:Carboxypeptidase regulatory-like domain
VVTDSSGTAMPGVSVTLTGPDKRSAVTNTRGEFVFNGLRPGDYQVDSALSGFSTVRRSITVSPGQTMRLSIEMRLGSLQETITVTGSTAVVDGRTALRSVADQNVAGVAVGGSIAPPRRSRRSGNCLVATGTAAGRASIPSRTIASTKTRSAV